MQLGPAPRLQARSANASAAEARDLDGPTNHAVRQTNASFTGIWNSVTERGSTWNAGVWYYFGNMHQFN